MAALYIDNDVTVRAAPLLRRLGHSVVTTAELNRREAGDHEQLLLAAQSGWVLVTHNWNDFRLLDAAWHLWSAAWSVSPAHGGILVVDHGTEQQIAETVDSFFAGPNAEAPTNRLFRFRQGPGWVPAPSGR